MQLRVRRIALTGFDGNLRAAFSNRFPSAPTIRASNAFLDQKDVVSLKQAT